MSEKIYSSRVCDTYLKLIRAKYPHVDINSILRHAGMELAEVSDPGYWFTQKQINLFYERVVLLTGNENIAREAGRYAASPEALGAMRQYTLGMIGPASAFSMVSKLSKNFSKSSDYVSKKVSNNVVEVTASPKQGTKEEEFQCKNRLGFLEALVMIFNYSAPKIEHPECIFKGDEVCRYVLRWGTESGSYMAEVQKLLCCNQLCNYIRINDALSYLWPNDRRVDRSYRDANIITWS